jgi:hypothetical protein
MIFRVRVRRSQVLSWRIRVQTLDVIQSLTTPGPGSNGIIVGQLDSEVQGATSNSNSTISPRLDLKGRVERNSQRRRTGFGRDCVEGLRVRLDWARSCTVDRNGGSTALGPFRNPYAKSESVAGSDCILEGRTEWVKGVDGD